MDISSPLYPVYATPLDLEAWMDFVAEIKENFPWLGPLDVYRFHLHEHIMAGEALCIKDGARVIGVALILRAENRLLCLAVSPAYRRRGLATRLLHAAVKELDAHRAITVRTFRAEDPRGTAPRAMYARFGFTEGALGWRGGYPVQTFILSAYKYKGENT